MDIRYNYSHNIERIIKKIFLFRRKMDFRTATVLCFLQTIATIGCESVEVEPAPTSINSANVYATDATSQAVLTGIYAKMSNFNFTSASLPCISLLAGLSADELTLYSGLTNVTLKQYYTNALTNSIGTSYDLWSNIYPVIFIANSAFEGINNSNSLTPSVKQQLLGEAKFIRAFCYFYLVNLYGDVPIAKSTDFSVNSLVARSPKAVVWNLIIEDLKDAQNLLSSTYLDGTILKTSTERVRPSKWVATALLARAYLYTGDWANAEAQATTLIENTAYFNLSSLSNAFIKSSLGNNEAIWQLQSVKAGYNSVEAVFFTIPPTGPNNVNSVYLSDNLLGAFENGDNRKTNWINNITIDAETYYFPFKYKLNTTSATSITEYETIFRLGEQFLIRAEARAQLNETNSVDDLNQIRLRAGLSAYNGPNTKLSILTAIYHERQVELFTEWGHRWFDLKRTENVDAVMNLVTPQKGGQWNSNSQLYPIQLTELQANPNLNQNSGY